MPQERGYNSSRRRSRSHSRGKRGHRRRSSGSSYSRSRSRSVEKRYHDKDRSSRRSPQKYRHASKHSTSNERKRQTYDRVSRSTSSSPRRQRSRDKKAMSPVYLESSKVLSGNFDAIPGLEFIGRDKDGGGQMEPKSNQDLDMRLRELETQQSGGGASSSSRSRRGSNQQSKQGNYYEASKRPSSQSGRQRSKSPMESKYDSVRYNKDGSLSHGDGDRYREQPQRPDYGIRVEVKRKPSPKRRKFDPALVSVPRRKDEGLTAIFDRPEIIVRTLEDDPELYPEKYERFACWRKSPPSQPERQRRNDREYSRERDERPKKQSRRRKDSAHSARSPTPEPPAPAPPPRATTVMMKPFTVYEKYEQSLRSRPQEVDTTSFFPQTSSQDFVSPSQALSQTSLPLSEPTSIFSSGLSLDSMLDLSSDLRQDLDVRRQIIAQEAEKRLDMRQAQLRAALAASATSSALLTSLPSGGSYLDRREITTERRPVRERLGDLDGNDLNRDGADEVPDFRKEVEELQRLDPESQPFRGTFFQHDDRDPHESSVEKRPFRPPVRGRGSFVPRGTYRGRGYIRGYRGGYTRGFTRGGFRGGYRGGFNRGAHRGFSSSWKHDKFEDKEKHSSSSSHKEKRDKKEKKSKSSDKVKDKKKTKKSSKKTPEKAKSKKESSDK